MRLSDPLSPLSTLHTVHGGTYTLYSVADDDARVIFKRSSCVVIFTFSSVFGINPVKTPRPSTSPLAVQTTLQTTY